MIKMIMYRHDNERYATHERHATHQPIGVQDDGLLNQWLKLTPPGATASYNKHKCNKPSLAMQIHYLRTNKLEAIRHCTAAGKQYANSDPVQTTNSLTFLSKTNSKQG